ncbi:MAG TPA: hypothetical protein VK611_26940, partial [Acidimicrobiales bacterium]|nr:hypothetical protein [Acidimicrobiales bacterium]
MPLRPLLAPPPEPPVVVPPFPTPAPPPPAREYIEWTPAGGPTLILSEHNYEGIMLGGGEAYPPIIGLDMPPQEEFDTLLIGGGELFNGRRWAARLISLPVVIHADSLDQLRLYRRQLMGSFNPALGDGVLTIAYPDGVRRHISARYSSGLDIAEIGRIGYPYTDVFSITLKARDPFPYGDLAVIAFDPPQSYQFFAPPGDTVNVFYISSANTTGDADVIIDGEVETWPEFVLGGPMTTAALRNRDSNKLLSLTPNLTVNQTLTVRMDPQTSPTRKFTRETGASVWAGVAGQFPVMWSLRPGLN